MSKYGDLIKKVRETEPEDQITINTEDQITINTEDQITINTEDQITINTENQKTINPEDQKAGLPEDQITINTENQKARKPKNQKTINPEDQESGLPEDQKAINTENQKTRKPNNQKTRKPNNQKSGKPEQELEQEEMVNLCVKVPISQRRYWMSKAKEQGITVTSVILEALKEKFGLPENQKTRKPNQWFFSSSDGSKLLSTRKGQVELGVRTDNGFEVVEAGVQIFEKKAKELKPESSTVAAETAASWNWSDRLDTQKAIANLVLLSPVNPLEHDVLQNASSDLAK